MVHRLVGVPPKAEQVDSGDHGEHRRLGDADDGACRFHLQRVGDHHAGEAKLTAQQPADGGRRQGRGQRTGQLGHPQVPGHEDKRPGGDGRDERGQVASADLRQRPGDRRERQVRVIPGTPVPGEVLRASHYPGRLQTGDGGGDMPGHQRGIRSERPGAHNRAAAQVEHVGVGREVGVDPEPGQVGPDGGVHGPGERDIVHRAEGGVSRVGRPGRVRQPRDVAAFLVDGDDRLDRRRGPEGGGERGRVTDHVLAEEGDAGQSPRERVQCPEGSRGPWERRDEDRVGEGAEYRIDGRFQWLERRHPFTAPATRPLASRRWVTRKNARTGTVKRVEDAMIAPQSVEFWP